MINIVVSGRHIDVGESLRSHIEERLQLAVAKYIDRINTINVVVSKQGHSFRIDISGNLGTHSGLTVKSRCDAPDAYVAADEAIEKVAKQLRRYKRQITNHHTKDPEEALQKIRSKYYVISNESEKEEAPDNPVIIAEDASHIEHLTVSDALMRLDLGELPALVFINQANSRVNVIYRRNDGNIGWIDPESNEMGSIAA
jgi:ribosomal subunit interface protein